MQIENWMGRLSRWGSFFKVLTMVIWSVKTEFIPIQRCFLPYESVISLQLHGFGDGSEVAYAAAVYLGVEASQGVYVYLLMNKSRAVPLSKQAIPSCPSLFSPTSIGQDLWHIFLERFHYDSALDKGGGQRIQAIRWEKSQFINTRHNNLHV